MEKAIFLGRQSDIASHRDVENSTNWVRFVDRYLRPMIWFERNVSYTAVRSRGSYVESGVFRIVA